MADFLKLAICALLIALLPVAALADNEVLTDDATLTDMLKKCDAILEPDEYHGDYSACESAIERMNAESIENMGVFGDFLHTLADKYNIPSVQYFWGGLQPKEEKLNWYRRAAENGHGEARLYLGMEYYFGNGSLPQDYGKAVKWFRLAGESGVTSAHIMLGGVYRNGEGVPVDMQESYVWYFLAEREGHGANGMRLAAAHLTPEQIRAAEAEAARIAENF